jgi:Holliday junction resolvasome RuvABC endonuclease subunit
MENKIVAGIDYSYTSPAICIFGGDFNSSKHYFLNGRKTLEKVELPKNFGFHLMRKDFSCDQERWYYISKWAMYVLTQNKVTHVNLEGYAYGSIAGQVFQIAENTGLLKHSMWKEGIEFQTHAPSAVKKSFQGKGNAKKEQMGEHLLISENVDVVSILGLKSMGNPASDIIDAYALARISI